MFFSLSVRYLRIASLLELMQTGTTLEHDKSEKKKMVVWYKYDNYYQLLTLQMKIFVKAESRCCSKLLPFKIPKLSPHTSRKKKQTISQI